jgi:CheY-like chemotaxis protein
MDTPPPARRVLVVDDNPDAAESLAAILRLHGHQATVAWNGEEALAAARRVRPDVVLLDLGMPVLNGFQAARRLRDDPEFGSPVLMAVTAWGTDEDRRRTREAGFAHHLVKPADPAEVLALLAGPGGGA